MHECFAPPPVVRALRRCTTVMAGLVPAISERTRSVRPHAVRRRERRGFEATARRISKSYAPKGVDGRDKPGHDVGEVGACVLHVVFCPHWPLSTSSAAPRPSWPGLSRPSTPFGAADAEDLMRRRGGLSRVHAPKGVRTNAARSLGDGRDKPGHDVGEVGACVSEDSLTSLAPIRALCSSTTVMAGLVPAIHAVRRSERRRFDATARWALEGARSERRADERFAFARRWPGLSRP